MQHHLVEPCSVIVLFLLVTLSILVAIVGMITKNIQNLWERCFWWIGLRTFQHPFAYICVCGCLLRKHVWPSLTYPVYQLSSPPQHCIQLLWEWQWLIEPAIDLHFLSQVWHIKLSPGGENWIRSIIIFVCLIRLNLCLHILEQVEHSKHALTIIYIYYIYIA